MDFTPSHDPAGGAESPAAETPVVRPVERPPGPPPRPPRSLKFRAGFKAWMREVRSTHFRKSSGRIQLVALAFAGLFLLFIGRLAYFGTKPDPRAMRSEPAEAVTISRPDIVDRNGELLAKDVKVMSVYAEPRRIIDKDEATELITAILPDLNADELRKKLGSRKGFVWVKREVTPEQRREIFHLGLPGIGFLPVNKRVYPNGPLAAHTLGFTNSDNRGIAGIEKYIDGQGLDALNAAGFDVRPEDLKPIALSLDMRATHALRDELEEGLKRFHAKSAAAAVLNVNTGEVIAAASLPDFDPNDPVQALKPDTIDQLTVGVHEMGSTFKAFTIAMALQSGKVNLDTRVDVSHPLRAGHMFIHDFEPQHHPITVPQIFTYSSNIGAAKLALMVGVKGHQAFLRKMGQLARMQTELPEGADPILPRHWSDVSTMTIAFGHGLAVAPLQAMMGVAALVNGGYLITPTFLKRPRGFDKTKEPHVVSEATSEALRYIMRLNAIIGTAKKANIPGYFVGGKTGTADKVINGRYSKHRVFTTFMAVVPADKPRYLFMTVMDDPKGLKQDGGWNTSAYNSGYITGRLIERICPLLDYPPRLKLPTKPFPLLARMGYGFANAPPITGAGDH